jgi:hypothetical protein
VENERNRRQTRTRRQTKQNVKGGGDFKSLVCVSVLAVEISNSVAEPELHYFSRAGSQNVTNCITVSSFFPFNFITV